MKDDKNPSDLLTENAELKSKIAELTALVKYYEEQFRLAKHRQFGVSSEKSRYDSDQLSIFNEAEATADVNVLEPELQEIQKHYRKRKRLVNDNGVYVGNGASFVVILFDADMVEISRHTILANGAPSFVGGLTRDGRYYLTEAYGSWYETQGFNGPAIGFVAGNLLELNMAGLLHEEERLLAVTVNNLLVANIPVDEYPYGGLTPSPGTGDDGIPARLLVLLGIAVGGMLGTLWLMRRRKVKKEAVAARATKVNLTSRVATIYKASLAALKKLC